MELKVAKLTKFMAPYVQRKDGVILKQYIPTKTEFSLFIGLSSTQTKLYAHYKESVLKSFAKKTLLTDYHVFRQIWTHTRVLEGSFDVQEKQTPKNRQQQKQDPKNRWWRSLVDSEKEDVNLSVNLQINLTQLKIFIQYSSNL